MKRKIKFRAWDKDLEMMMPAVDLSSPLREYKWLGYVDLPLMQYTGLKDKKGKEIYEGDIIIGYSGYGGWKLKNFVVENLDGTKFEVWNQVNTTRDLCDVVDIEVVGNIYENPNLLK